jgi:DNA primase
VFDRSRLPSPEQFLHQQGVRLRGSGLWQSALCPFHDDKQASFRVQASSGAYRCMACGKHGGGVIDFYMDLHGVDFKSAAKALGAWHGRS